MTALWTARDAAAAVGVEPSPGAAWAACGVSIDTRSVASSDLFVALKGPRFDGHDFVASALSGGAVAAMVDRSMPDVDPTRLLAVPDTQVGLEALARAARARSRAKIIAVTGSVGKTGTKEALSALLGRQGATYASSGNLNNQIGLPLSLARLPVAAAFGIFEMGMNHAGEIAPLSELARPHVAIITTVEPVHLENFPDVEAIADAKAEIFAGMGADGIAILNRDNAFFGRISAHAGARGLGRIWSFGASEGADARLLSASLTGAGSEVEAIVLGRGLRFRVGLPGRHQAMNALAVLLAVAAVGGDIDKAALALSDLQPVKGRGTTSEVLLAGGGFRLIDETYNASPAAVRAALSVLSMIEPGPGGRRLVVLGDMLELGGAAISEHAGLAAALIEAGADQVFTAGPLMRHLHEALPARLRAGHAADAASLAPLVVASVRAGDVVLAKGSAASRMNEIVAALRAQESRSREPRRAV